MPSDTATTVTIQEAVADARRGMEAVADPHKAAAMAVYMKHRATFYGVQKPLRTPVLRTLITAYQPSTDREYHRLVRALWAEPMREMRYLALGVAKRWHSFHTMAHLPLFKSMVISGAWWDLVDDVAANLAGPVVRSDPEAAWNEIDTWIDHEDMWVRRAAILCQLKSKDLTDQRRLFAFCEARAHEQEFFIRKAIGWALRQHSRTNRQAVIGFLEAHRDELSSLSLREAAKHLEPI